MAIDPFLLLVVDHDKKEFTVEGPMTDDTKWNDAVVAAQDTGRQVNCHTPGGILPEVVVRDWENSHPDYRLVARGSIVRR